MGTGSREGEGTCRLARPACSATFDSGLESSLWVVAAVSELNATFGLTGSGGRCEPCVGVNVTAETVIGVTGLCGLIEAAELSSIEGTAVFGGRAGLEVVVVVEIGATCGTGATELRSGEVVTRL